MLKTSRFVKLIFVTVSFNWARAEGWIRVLLCLGWWGGTGKSGTGKEKPWMCHWAGNGSEQPSEKCLRILCPDRT